MIRTCEPVRESRPECPASSLADVVSVVTVDREPTFLPQSPLEVPRRPKPTGGIPLRQRTLAEVISHNHKAMQTDGRHWWLPVTALPLPDDTPRELDLTPPEPYSGPELPFRIVSPDGGDINATIEILADTPLSSLEVIGQSKLRQVLPEHEAVEAAKRNRRNHPNFVTLTKPLRMHRVVCTVIVDLPVAVKGGAS